MLTDAELDARAFSGRYALDSTYGYAYAHIRALFLCIN